MHVINKKQNKTLKLIRRIMYCVCEISVCHSYVCVSVCEESSGDNRGRKKRTRLNGSVPIDVQLHPKVRAKNRGDGIVLAIYRIKEHHLAGDLIKTREQIAPLTQETEP